MSKARPPLLLSLFAALTVLVGCAPSLPELTSQLVEGDLAPDRVLAVDGWEAEIVLCEQPRLAAAWDKATPEERRTFLDLAIQLVSRSYDPGATSPSPEETARGGEDGAAGGDDMDHSDHGDHGDHGAGEEVVERPALPNDPTALADVWRTALAGRAFEECAGIEARRSSHH